MNEELRQLACAIRANNCGCGKPKNDCGCKDKCVTNVVLARIPGTINQRQHIVSFSDGSTVITEFTDENSDDNTFVENYITEDGILYAIYNNGVKKQILNLLTFTPIREFKELKQSISGLVNYYFKDTDIEIDCTGIPKIPKCNKPYRKGNSVYIINEYGEEEFLFDVTDINTNPAPPPNPPTIEEYNLTYTEYTDNTESNVGGRIVIS